MSSAFPARTVTAWALLAVFSTLMGWVLVRGMAFHQPHEMPRDWKGAQWVGLGPADDKLYLRRSVILGAPPSAAQLMVAGTDHFEVFLNGQMVGRESFLGARPSATFDLTRLLRPGVNVVAIQVTRSTKPLAAQALALLEWREGERVQRQPTDATWRAHSRRELQAAGGLDWNATDYDDNTWRFARVSEGLQGTDLPQPHSLASELLEPAPRARWLWHGDPQSGVGAFARVLRLDSASVSAGWLGVSVNGVYTVGVNGVVFGSVIGSDSRMDVLDVAPFLQGGDNRIEVQVSGGHPPMRLAVVGRVRAGQDLIDFSSDERWLQRPGGGPAAVLAGFQSPRPALTFVKMPPPRAWWRAQTARWLGSSVLIGGALLVLGLLLTRGHARERRPDLWMRHAQPLAAASVLIGLALLADLDPRVQLEPYYVFWVPAAALALAALMAFAMARRGDAPEETS